jgi:hypothetical protein
VKSNEPKEKLLEKLANKAESSGKRKHRKGIYIENNGKLTVNLYGVSALQKALDD